MCMVYSTVLLLITLLLTIALSIVVVYLVGTQVLTIVLEKVEVNKTCVCFNEECLCWLT